MYFLYHDWLYDFKVKNKQRFLCRYKTIPMQLEINLNSYSDYAGYMNPLVIYYSRTGNTAMVAEALADGLSCPAEAIHDAVKRSGLIGWLRSGRQAMRGETTELEPLQHDPGDFDLVVVGTPVWGGTMSTPVRSFLEKQRDDLPQVAFFCTAGSDETAGTFADMAACCGQPPMATLGISRNMIKKQEWRPAVERFIAELREVKP